MNILHLSIFLISIVKLPNVQSLKCRTREHMKQQQDFYNLATYCMKSSMNLTQSIGGNSGGSWDYRFPHRQQNGNRHNDYYDTNRHQDGRHDHSKTNFGDNNDSMSSQDANTCAGHIDSNNYYHNNNNNKELHNSKNHRKRETEMVQKYSRKNTTSNSKNKSPLEEIGACVIHCIFREMNMLSKDSKADRVAMENVMTRNIRDSELKEFIQDSIEECFDILESNYDHEEQCNFSKKLILCLEEKTRRSCEDWEIPLNTTQTSNFNFNTQNEERKENTHQRNNQNGYLAENSFNRYTNYNTRQIKT